MVTCEMWKDHSKELSFRLDMSLHNSSSNTNYNRAPYKVNL